MAITKSLENKMESKMMSSFQTNADNPKVAIHVTAVAGAGICAALPIGVDAWALRIAETIMVCCIATLYGEKLTRSAARGILASSLAQFVGEAAALTALEAANAANILTPWVAYGIKAGVAVSLIEAIGHTAVSHYENKYKTVDPKKFTAFDAVCVAGGVAEVVRIANMAGELSDQAVDTAAAIPPDSTVAGDISFLGRYKGYSMGHSIDYWKEKLAQAIKDGRPSGIHYAEKRIKECLEDAVKHAQA